MKNLHRAVLFVMLVMCIYAVTAETNYPKLNQRVTDFTNTLSYQEWQKIDQELKSYEDTTSTQVVVLMINSLEGESIEEYANKTFALNKIGQEKKDNGVLLLIAKQDHKVRIEVGYGLEGALTDAISSQIIRNEIRPYFQADNYFGGIATGVDAIVRVTRGEYQADTKGNKAPAISVGLVFMVLMFGIFVLLPLISSRRRSVIDTNGHSYFSGWGYGGGSFGGFGGGSGGGGFSGGGGMSGGGGASGSW